MKLTTQRDLIRIVAKRWRDTYSPFKGELPIFSVRNGFIAQKSKEQIANELDALDRETATPADVEAIIGNGSWTRLTCDECKNDVDTILTVGQNPDYDDRSTDLCLYCVNKAFLFVSRGEKK